MKGKYIVILYFREVQRDPLDIDADEPPGRFLLEYGQTRRRKWVRGWREGTRYRTKTQAESAAFTAMTADVKGMMGLVAVLKVPSKRRLKATRVKIMDKNKKTGAIWPFSRAARARRREQVKRARRGGEVNA